MSEISEQVWVVKVHINVGSNHYYAAVETIEDAIAGVRRIHAVNPKDILGANRIKNVENVPDSEIRLVPEGDYSGPLIP